MRNITLGLITLLVIGCGNTPKYRVIGTTTNPEDRKVFIYQEVGGQDYGWSYQSDGTDIGDAWMGGGKVYLKSNLTTNAYPRDWVKEVK